MPVLESSEYVFVFLKMPPEHIYLRGGRAGGGETGTERWGDREVGYIHVGGAGWAAVRLLCR